MGKLAQQLSGQSQVKVTDKAGKTAKMNCGGKVKKMKDGGACKCGGKVKK